MTRIDMIVTAANQTAGDNKLTELLGGNQSGSFSIQLSPSGDAPATHFGMSYGAPDEIAQTLEGVEDLWIWNINTNEESPYDGFETWINREEVGLKFVQLGD